MATTATTASAKFIAPFCAGMAASGSADYVYVQQETVTIGGINYEFDMTLSSQQTVDLLNSFTRSG